jgi:hypothetical protein
MSLGSTYLGGAPLGGIIAQAAAASPQTITLTEVPSTVTFPTLTLSQNIVLTEVASTVTFPTLTLKQNITLTSVASTVSFGSLTVTRMDPQTITLTSVASTVTFPTLTIANAPTSSGGSVGAFLRNRFFPQTPPRPVHVRTRSLVVSAKSARALASTASASSVAGGRVGVRVSRASVRFGTANVVGPARVKVHANSPKVRSVTNPSDHELIELIAAISRSE